MGNDTKSTKARAATSANEGEGNKTADRNYREATQKFVNSERGRTKIRDAGTLTPEEERESDAAEAKAKSHAKEFDPEETRAQRK